MGSKIGFENEFDHCRGNTWTMCEFHESTCNGLVDIWWTDNPIYFSSIDYYERMTYTSMFRLRYSSLTAQTTPSVAKLAMYVECVTV